MQVTEHTTGTPRAPANKQPEQHTKPYCVPFCVGPCSLSALTYGPLLSPSLSLSLSLSFSLSLSMYVCVCLHGKVWLCLRAHRGPEAKLGVVADAVHEH